MFLISWHNPGLSKLVHQQNYIIWVNYNISLTCNKPIWGWFLLLTMIPVRSQWGRYNLPRYNVGKTIINYPRLRFIQTIYGDLGDGLLYVCIYIMYISTSGFMSISAPCWGYFSRSPWRRANGHDTQHSEVPGNSQLSWWRFNTTEHVIINIYIYMYSIYIYVLYE